MNAVITRRMKINDFARRKSGASSDFIQVETEFRIVANRDFHGRNFRRIVEAAVPATECSANSLFQPIDQIFDRRACFDSADRIVKKGNCRVGRREFDYARNFGGG